MPTAVKAIIFDYGNVLTEPQNAEQIEAMASLLNLPREEFETAYWRFRASYDEAKLRPLEYWTALAEMAGRTVSASQIDKLIELDSLSWTVPRSAMSDWARRLRRAGFRTALLSNMPVTLREALRACPWLPDFDERTLSCDLGVSKPAREIYLYCLSGLGISPADALFLDDREPNVRAARDLGMHAIEFTTTAGLAREMSSNFDLPPPLSGC